VQKLSYSKKGILKKWQEEYNKGGGGPRGQSKLQPNKTHPKKNSSKLGGGDMLELKKGRRTQVIQRDVRGLELHVHGLHVQELHVHGLHVHDL
jgi:hypothetical protein